MIAAADLRKVELLADLPENELTWLGEQGEEMRLLAGEALFQPGDPADYMFAVIEGESQIRRNGEHGKLTSTTSSPARLPACSLIRG